MTADRAQIEEAMRRNIERVLAANPNHGWEEELEEHHDAAGRYYKYDHGKLIVSQRYVYDGNYPRYFVDYQFNPPKVTDRTTHREVASPIELNKLIALRNYPRRIEIKASIGQRLYSWIKRL